MTLGWAKSIYTKKKLDEFATFQDSQRTRRAYLAETAELAYIIRNERGEWVLALGAQDGRHRLTARGQEHLAVKKADTNKGSVPYQGDLDC
jgi:hypothetical protein